jgi:hypothetical protein
MDDVMEWLNKRGIATMRKFTDPNLEKIETENLQKVKTQILAK